MENKSHLPDGSPNIEFVRLIAKHERSVRGFVRSLLPQSDYVDDIMQEVFVVAWKKFDRLREPEDFPKWICTIAKFEVLNFRRRIARDRLVLSDELVALIADEGCDENETRKEQLCLLEECIQSLPTDRRQLIRQAYLPGIPISKIASQVNKSENALYQILWRIRRSLWTCVQRKMAMQR